MTEFEDIAHRLTLKSTRLPIHKKELEEVLDILIHNILFPICNCSYTSIQRQEYILHVHNVLLRNISALIDARKAQEVIDSFLNNLPYLQESLYRDAIVYNDNDPAAKSIEEVIITYPGFFALVVHRVANIFSKLDVPIIPRLFSEYAHSKVGIDIHPAAQIGNSFYIDHGTGIVIGETTSIGNNVTIYQGVTLGALFVTKELSNEKRHPTIEDNVVIYAGATILGGNTVIGHDSVIGGNVWLTRSVEPYSQVVNNSEVKIKSTLDFSQK